MKKLKFNEEQIGFVLPCRDLDISLIKPPASTYDLRHVCDGAKWPPAPARL